MHEPHGLAHGSWSVPMHQQSTESDMVDSHKINLIEAMLYAAFH